MTWVLFAALCLVCALVPAVLYAKNVRLYRTPVPIERPLPPVSILIPARNESRSIEAALTAALASRDVTFEIIVLDDHSEDDTAAIVDRIALLDSRVRLEKAPELPAGWCGKQHACFHLSKLARHSILVFLDADVRLAPDGLARMIGFLESSGADLVSGFPRQETETFLERLLIPLIHFLLLGFLAIGKMRRTRRAAFAAGCGQLFVMRREAYKKVGGHAAVKASLHDGLMLPRAFRISGCSTDLCDATDIATCRMYRSAREVWIGLAKNAREGLASPRLLLPVTLMLLLGQLAPAVLLIYFLTLFAKQATLQGAHFDMLMASLETSGIAAGLGLSALALLASYYPRVDAMYRFRQSRLGMILHPFGIILLLAIQWYALLCWLFGGRSTWKGRAY